MAFGREGLAEGRKEKKREKVPGVEYNIRTVDFAMGDCD
jgi:hypothetical protein